MPKLRLRVKAVIHLLLSDGAPCESKAASSTINTDAKLCPMIAAGRRPWSAIRIVVTIRVIAKPCSSNSLTQ